MLGNVAIYVPASSKKMIMKSFELDVDTIIFDLEDAVAAEEKEAARNLLKQCISKTNFQKRIIVVRINSLDSPFWESDMKLIESISIGAVLIPKASANDVKKISEMLDEFDSKLTIAIIPLIESAIAIENIADIILSSHRVRGVVFGGEDYSLDMGVKRSSSSQEILYARMRIGNVAHSYNIEAMDTVYTEIKDISGLYEDTLKGKQLGFTGRTIIHPSHIKVIKDVYKPSEEEIKYAKDLLNNIGLESLDNISVFSYEGKMIDKPIIARAIQTLKKAGINERDIFGE